MDVCSASPHQARTERQSAEHAGESARHSFTGTLSRGRPHPHPTGRVRGSEALGKQATWLGIGRISHQTCWASAACLAHNSGPGQSRLGMREERRRAQVAEGLGKAPRPMLGARGAEGPGETEVAVRWTLRRIVATRGRPGARPGHIPAFQPFPVTPARPGPPPALACFLSVRAHATPRYLPCAPTLSPVRTPTYQKLVPVSPLPTWLPGSPPSTPRQPFLGHARPARPAPRSSEGQSEPGQRR